jgi:hypothetical protein
MSSGPNRPFLCNNDKMPVIQSQHFAVPLHAGDHLDIRSNPRIHCMRMPDLAAVQTEHSHKSSGRSAALPLLQVRIEIDRPELVIEHRLIWCQQHRRHQLQCLIRTVFHGLFRPLIVGD